MRFSITRGAPEEKQTELVVTLTSEQWLDVIESMRDEYEFSVQSREILEDLYSGNIEYPDEEDLNHTDEA